MKRTNAETISKYLVRSGRKICHPKNFDDSWLKIQPWNTCRRAMT
jgi:hypothetical protein